MRNFNEWIAQFKSSISDYRYYVDFQKVFGNVDSIKVELNILNSLIGSSDIEAEFDALLGKYPEILKCIPLLLAVRERELYAIDEEGECLYNFYRANCSPAQYKVFMRKTGLFDLMERHIVNNLVDYVTGVEVGLDSNGRKNRGGHLMEDLVESYIIKAGLIKGKDYFKEMYLSEIERKWNIDLSSLSNNGDAAKRFDFVIKTPETIYAIETNFYKASGSKLNETARSYKMLAQESRNIDGFAFVWFTDGTGWLSAKHNLKETFDVLENIFCIKDLENGAIEKLIHQ
ncbi:MAG: restriction endonuclease [Clostridia bacterium]|nr:restriction endonuclease [Clostridia bacterium]